MILSLQTRRKTPAMPEPDPSNPFAGGGEFPPDKVDPDWLYFLQHVRPDGHSYVLEVPARGSFPPVSIKYEEPPVASSGGDAQSASGPSPAQAQARSDRRMEEEEDSSADPPWYESDAGIDEDYRIFLRHMRVVNDRMVLEIGGRVVIYEEEVARSGGSSEAEGEEKKDGEEDAAIAASGEEKKDGEEDAAIAASGEEKKDGEEDAAIAASGEDGVGEEEEVISSDVPGEDGEDEDEDEEDEDEDEVVVISSDGPGREEEEVISSDEPGREEEEVISSDGPGREEEEVISSDGPGGEEEEVVVISSDGPGEEEEEEVVSSNGPGGNNSEPDVRDCRAPGQKVEEDQEEKEVVAPASGKDGAGKDEGVGLDRLMVPVSEPGVCGWPADPVLGQNIKVEEEEQTPAVGTPKIVNEEASSSNGHVAKPPIATGLHGVIWPTHIIERPESGFKQRLMHVLGKPFCQGEYDKLYGMATHRNMATKERRTRRGVKYYYSSHEKSKSYYDCYPDLAKQVEGTSYPNRLALLRGFFFWLENIGQEDQFRPWRDDHKHYKVIPLTGQDYPH